MMTRIFVFLALELIALVSAQDRAANVLQRKFHTAPEDAPCNAFGVVLCRNVPYPNAPVQLFVDDSLFFDQQKPFGKATTDQNGLFNIRITLNSYIRITHMCAPPSINIGPGCWLETYIQTWGPGRPCESFQMPHLNLEQTKVVEKCK